MHRLQLTKQNNRRAFTLVELVIVLTIVGILSAVAVPRMGMSVRRHRVSVAANRIAADLGLARAQARDHSISVTVTFDVNNDSYTLGGVKDMEKAGQDYRVRLRDEPYGVDLMTADFNGDAIVVYDLYGIPDDAGSVSVGLGSWFETVSIDADLGLVSVD